MEPRQRRFSLWYVVVALLVWVLAEALFPKPAETTLSYSDFKTLVAAGKVEDAAIGKDTISGTVSTQGLEGVLPADRIAALKRAKGPSRFVTARVEDPGLVSELQAKKVRYTGRLESGWLTVLKLWILPLLIMWLIWRIAIGRTATRGGLLEIGRSKARVYVAQSTGVTFADVAGIDEAKAELMEIVDFLKAPERYRRLGGKIPKGVLIVGAPGTGKTLLAKALAGEAKVPFLSLTGSDFVEMFVGIGAARVRDLFAQAQGLAPSIIFIDELDALGRTRSVMGAMGTHEEREQTLNQLLAEMDGFDTRKGVLILAATNRPEILDPALLRPGRFDRKVVIDRPDLKGREQILRVHTRQVVLAPGVDLADIAQRTPGFVGADLENLVNEAALAAARAGKPSVDMDDFEQSIDRIVAGLERKSRVISPKEKEVVAHHEAGHALIAELRPHADKVAKISIIPRGVGVLGHTRQMPAQDRYLLGRAELMDRIDVLLGGRTAEELIFGDVSTGAQEDLQQATDLARHMVARFGMSEALGLAAFEQPRPSIFLDVPAAMAREYSEETARIIDAEIRKLLDASHERVRETLSQQRDALVAVARLLMEKEVVDREALKQVLGTVQPERAA